MPARWYVANAPRSARSGADAEESRGRGMRPRRPRDARTPQPRADALWESGEGRGAGDRPKGNNDDDGSNQ